ncbi:uncharacterized protein BDV14DRAFT_106987 [Aspergillus stella-maris]|uniref:uncharacterized protein n=1 Tax=Aspergillus stella-maris TaxID=1810926 RepID=UPI003CCD1531
MQEEDAERRIKLLRGERPPTPPPAQPSTSASQSNKKPDRHYTGGNRKRRRLAGENDTDRDIRYAREDAELALAKRDELVVHARKDKGDASLYDRDGHINLFPEEKSRKRVEKNPEAEKEAADKQRSYEDQYTMRFSNAAGFRQDIGKNPWYSASRSADMASESLPSKDVWGNEDPLRKEREKARMEVNDPLAAMKRGVRQLKSVEEERKKWNAERNREFDALKSTEESRSRHRRRRSRSRDSLEDFKLDGSPDHGPKDRHRRSDKRHRHSRHETSSRSHRRRSRSRSPSRSHHHSRHRYRHDDRRDSRRRETEVDSRHKIPREG